MQGALWPGGRDVSRGHCVGGGALADSARGLGVRSGHTGRPLAPGALSPRDLSLPLLAVTL